MNPESLFSNPLFSVIPQEGRKEFLENTKFVIKHFKQGDVIIHQDDIIDAFYFLSEGKVEAEMISDSGDVLKVEVVTAPSPLALAFLFSDKNRFPVEVMAIEDSELIIFPKQSILKLLSANEDFMREYISFTSAKTQFLSERIKFLSIKTIKGKLAYYILNRTVGNEFDLELNQTDLAEYFGVARPSLARSLAEIIDEGVISLDKKKGKILDIRKLKAMLV